MPSSVISRRSRTFKPEDWDRALAVNLSSAFHATRLVLPGMRQRDFGRIVNISSVYGLLRHGQSRRLRHDQDGADRLHPRRGARDRRPEHHLQRHLPRHVADARHRAAAGRLRWRRQGLSREEAVTGVHGLAPALGPLRGDRAASPRLVAFLCGPDGADITGAAIPIDGGWSASAESFSGSDTTPTRFLNNETGGSPMTVTRRQFAPAPPPRSPPARRRARLRPADQREREVAPDLELSQEPRHAVRRRADHRQRRSAN